MNTIACYGDSLIEGFPFAQEYSWIAWVEKYAEISMLNHGICGECCDDIKDRLIWKPLSKEITHVLFAGGMNDILQGCPLSFSIEQIKLAQRFCDQQGVPFGLMLPWFCGVEDMNPSIERMRTAMRRDFEGTCFLLDFEPMLSRTESRMAWFIWDGVHPKAETYEALGKYAAPLLKNWVSKK